MKRWTLVIGGIVLLLLGLLGVFKMWVRPASTLDLGKIAIDSGVAREWLGQDTVRIRNPASDYRPAGVVAVLTLEPISDWAARDLVDRLVRAYDVEGEVLYLDELMAVNGQDASLWVSRTSGAFKLTRTRESMTIESAISPEEAVQIALDHIVQEKLVALRDAEELDLVFVSAVKNAVASIGDEGVEDEFDSDHYVGFGRRYQGVPVVGSNLIVRLDGAGQVAMVQREWRRLEQERTAEAPVVDTPLAELILANAEVRERIGDGLSAAAVNIVGQRCGYLEAPVDHRQRQLRPGCEVSFRLGSSGDEAVSQIWVPLESDITVDQIFGETTDGRAPDAKEPRPKRSNGQR